MHTKTPLAIIDFMNPPKKQKAAVRVFTLTAASKSFGQPLPINSRIRSLAARGISQSRLKTAL
jgi:hypothetical protein